MIFFIMFKQGTCVIIDILYPKNDLRHIIMNDHPTYHE